MRVARLLLTLGLRNALRHRRRTAVTAATVLVGVLAICMLRGFLNTVQAELTKSITTMQTGDVQIVPGGYARSSEIAPLSATLPLATFARELLQDDAAVREWAPRIRYSGVLSSGTTVPFVSIGTDPERELRVCPRLAENVVRGRFLRSDSPHEIVVTKTLADSLGLEVGHEVVLLALTRDGTQNTIALKVVGILASMMRSDRFLTYTNIRAARELLHLGDDEAIEIVLSLRSPEDANGARDALAARAARAGLDADVLAWLDTVPFFRSVLKLQDAFNVIVSVLLFFLVGSVVVNALFMSVFERTREIGMMRALGMRAPQVVRMFVLEGLVIGLAGGMAGAALANLIMLVVRLRGGLVYTLATAFGAAKPWTLHPFLTARFTLLMCVFGAACGVAGALYPARRAARLEPVRSLADPVFS